MKNKEVLTLNQLISQTNFNNIKNGKFQYAIVKNLDMLDREYKAIEKTINSLKSDYLKALQEELTPLINAAAKGAKLETRQDQVDLENSVVKSWEKKEEYETEMTALQKLIDELEDQESDFKPHLIAQDLAESLELNTQQMYAVFKILRSPEQGK